jgi:hypothetical protein
MARFSATEAFGRSKNSQESQGKQKEEVKEVSKLQEGPLQMAGQCTKKHDPSSGLAIQRLHSSSRATPH